MAGLIPLHLARRELCSGRFLIYRANLPWWSLLLLILVFDDSIGTVDHGRQILQVLSDDTRRTQFDEQLQAYQEDRYIVELSETDYGI